MIKNLAIIIFLVSLAACKSKTAFNYSEEFVKKERTLGPDIQKAEADVASFNREEKYDSIAAIGQRMEKLLDTRLREIQDNPAPDVKEGDNFKNAGIKYFTFLKSIYGI